ncbi:MAG: GNAT family N-acetyltransferase [Methylococcales bacterium]
MIKTNTYDRIRNVPREVWDSVLTHHSMTYSYQFWEIMEACQLNDFSYQYLLFYNDQDHPIALTSFYTITTDIAIFAPKKLRSILQQIRRLWPDFLKVKMLECGTPITLNSPVAIGDDTASTEIIKQLGDYLIQLAKNQGHFLIVLRDFEPETKQLQPTLKQLGFHLEDSLPNTYMDIQWETPAQYLASMKSYYRSKLQKHLRINQEHGVSHELLDNFDDLAELLCQQWQTVHDHATEFQREVLSPQFYAEFSLKLGTSSKVLLFYRKKELIGHALLLMDKNMLRWLYFGRNEAINDSLYIYVGHKVVETAIVLGAKKLEMGLTTYAIKKDLGAYLSPIKLALRSPSTLINQFIGIFYPLLNHIPEIQNKSIFKTK